jgi:hypothetical protein
MTRIGEEILELMHAIQLRPTMYGYEQSVSGMVVALAAVLLRQEIQRPFGQAWPTVTELVREATKDVPCHPTVIPELCHEQIEPQVRLSYEAFKRHTRLFLDLLEKLLVQEKGPAEIGEGQQGPGEPRPH